MILVFDFYVTIDFNRWWYKKMILQFHYYRKWYFSQISANSLKLWLRVSPLIVRFYLLIDGYMKRIIENYISLKYQPIHWNYGWVYLHWLSDFIPIFGERSNDNFAQLALMGIVRRPRATSQNQILIRSHTNTNCRCLYNICTYVFVIFAKCIFQNWKMDLSKLINVFVWIELSGNWEVSCG